MTFRTISAAMVVVCLLCVGTPAAVYTWDAGGGSGATNWTTAANWNPDAASGQPSAADDVVFAPFNISGKTITLDAGEQVANVTFGANGVGWIDANATIPLTVVGGGNTLTYTGAFSYNAFGITPFGPALAGAAPTITHGALYLQNAGDAFTGTINVAGGMLYAASNNALGGADITLGSAGRFGGLGVSGSGTVVSRNITLSGNGGVIGGKSNGYLEDTGTISGSGQLLVLSGQGSGGMVNVGYPYFTKIDGNNTGFSGGMIVVNGGIAPGGASNLTNDVFGTGDIHIVDNGLLGVDSAANIGASAKIYVTNSLTGGGLLIGQNADYMPPIDSSSNGTILLGGHCATNINIALGSSTTPVGDGTMWLGTLPTDVVYGGASLKALILNDPTHTYKIGGAAGTLLELGNWGSNPGALQDVGGVPANVVVGKPGAESAMSGAGGTYVRLLDANTYTGTTTINPGATVIVMDYSYGSGIGTGGGDVTINGPGYPGDTPDGAFGTGLRPSMTVRGLWNGGAMLTKGNMTFNGAVAIAMEEGQAPDQTGKWNNPSGTSIAQVTVSNLTRSGRSTLAFYGWSSSIGTTNELFFDSGNATEAPLTGNMVPAYFWNGRTNEFLTYGATGFTQLTYTDTTNNVHNSLASTPSTGIAYTGAAAVAAGGQTVYAVRASGALTSAASSDVLTVGDGTRTHPAGVIFAAAATHTANFAFGGSEGIFITPLNCGTTISGTISGSYGFTKTGAAPLTLTADNTTSGTGAGLSGDVTVNQGSLIVSNVNQLGTGNVVLNGGALDFRGGVNFTRQITLGASGGAITAGNWGYLSFAGGITGAGFLNITNGGGGNTHFSIDGTNDYSGGTYLQNSDSLDFDVKPNSSLGTGPVYMAKPGWGGNSTDPADRNSLTLEGANNLANNRLVLTANDDVVIFRNALTYNVASIEGVGLIELCYGGAITTTIRVGANNLSTDYFGRIMAYDTRGTGCLTKVGTGTLTLWGDNSYTGTTVVNDGTLVNNNYINGGVSVGPVVAGQTPIYTGNGTTNGNVGVSAGGQFVGSGTVNGSVWVHGGSANMTNAQLKGGVYVTAGTFTGTSTIGNFVSVSGGVLGGANTMTVAFVKAPGGTLDGNNAITTTDGVYTDRDEETWGGYAGTIQGSGSIHGNLYLWTGGYNGTHTITGNVDVQDYWYFDTGSPADSNFAGKTTITGNVTLGSNGGSTGAVTFTGGHTIGGSLTVAIGNTQPVTISPHNATNGSAGTLTVGGGMTLGTTTALNFDLASPGTTGSGINDFIDITGNLSLDGTLNVTNLSGFGAGTYRLFNYTGTLTGSLLQGTMPTGFTYTIDTSITGQINLGVVTPYIPGDTDHSGGSTLNTLDIDAIYAHFGAASTSQWKVYPDTNPVGQEDVTYEVAHYMSTNYADANLDRYTDFTDFQVLLDHWQAPGGWGDGDFNGDGTVDFLDFQVLLDYWNPTGWSAGASQVPEPASLSLLLLGGLAVLRRKK